MPNIISTVPDVNNSLYSWKCLRKLLFMHKTQIEIAINKNDRTKFEKKGSHFCQ